MLASCGFIQYQTHNVDLACPGNSLNPPSPEKKSTLRTPSEEKSTPGISSEEKSILRTSSLGKSTQKTSSQGKSTPGVSSEGKSILRTSLEGKSTPKTASEGKSTPEISSAENSTPGTSLEENSTPKAQDLYSLPASTGDSSKEWGTRDSKILLDKYETYMIMVGPLKKFKNKKVMWVKIASGIKWTGEQCATRYKTIMKRKKYSEKNNKTSGSTRKVVEFEEEIAKISALDDSLEPEVARGVGIVNISDKRPVSPTKKDLKITKKTRINESVTETLYKISQTREEAKERRHREKMELLKSLFAKSTDEKDYD